jgi:Oligoketide cyclase/lipid transport protein
MHHICKTSVLPYSAGQVMALIEDIRSYPQFLPWCGRTRIIQDRDEEVVAELTISHGAFGKSFTTKNRYQRPKLAEVRLVNGPFRFLEGLWQLEPDPKGTRVTLDMRFEFASRLVARFWSPFLNRQRKPWCSVLRKERALCMAPLQPFRQQGTVHLLRLSS